MNNKNKSLMVLFVFVSLVTNAQVLTNSIEGYLITVIHKRDLKTKNIDVMRGYVFTPSDKKYKPLQLYIEAMYNLEQHRDSLFFISTNMLSNLNILFHTNFEAIKYERSLYPTLTNFTYKRKHKLYKSTFVKIKAIVKKVSVKEIIPHIPFPNYYPKSDSVYVFLIREIYPEAVSPIKR